MSSQKEPGTETNMEVDYVVVYRFADLEKAVAVERYQRLIQALASVGFATEVRNGENNSLLVFAKVASQEHMYAEIYRSRVRDWLHGVRTAAPDRETKDALDQDPMYPAERLRILYQLITNPRQEGGAGITPQKGEWENVEALFPLHDRDFNRTWMKKWASTSILKIEDLDEIRDRFGEKIAYYFAFTQAYFIALIAISVLGVSSWAILGNFSPVYGILNSLLCVGFVEYWNYQQDDLAVRWGVRGVSNIEVQRHDFSPEKSITDPVTGEQMAWFPSQKRLRRQLLQLPFALAASIALGTIIATAFAIEIFVSEVYSGPGQQFLVFLPTGILTTTMPLVLGMLTSLAEKLTMFENYDTDAAFEKSMIQKIFVLNFITSYLPILLTAFVYVPFAGILVPYLDIFSLTAKAFAQNDAQLQAPSTGRGGSFHINPNRLKKQVIYFTVTAQVVNQALEIVVPILKRRGMDKYKEVKSSRAAKKQGGSRPLVSAEDPEEEKAFLSRVRKEAELDVYDVATDFREMVVQYGYLALFSAVWPLTPVSFLINNWIELRTDAMKICVESQRPTPWRADSIGPWLDSLGFLTWFGSITTAAITYLFAGGGLGPDGEPEGIKAWALLLAIAFSEHAYFMIRWGARVFVSKLDSPGRQKERTERFQVRKRYLQEIDLMEQAARVAPTKQDDISRSSLEKEARASTLQTSTLEGRFWKRQRGWEESVSVGAGFIERAAADEGKKQK